MGCIEELTAVFPSTGRSPQWLLRKPQRLGVEVELLLSNYNVPGSVEYVDPHDTLRPLHDRSRASVIADVLC